MRKVWGHNWRIPDVGFYGVVRVGMVLDGDGLERIGTS